ncbi:MAG TPA: winged helix-turn-helix domain-containing protein, partial [Pyrinomonadaceae bacterium]
MTLEASSLYIFGAFRLDPVNRLLLRDGKRVALSPKTFEMLLLLVEGRGDVLSKNQLMETLWPDTFVEEANLTQHVATLRKALEENNGLGKYIETLPKVGYRFVAPVEIVTNNHPRSVVTRPSLAVLPFCLFGTAEADSFLSLGIADTLITKLSQSSQISVRSTSAVAKYETSSQHATQIGRLLNVDFVLTGRLYKQGELLRINLQLVSINDETTLWTEQFDLTCANIFAVENTLVRKVHRALLPAMTGVDTSHRRSRPTRSGAAYQAYLKGRYFWNRRSQENLKKGIECFKQAIAIDENYALAYAGLADSYLMLINYGEMSSREGFPLTKAATLKALEIDPDLGEAHASLAYINAAFEQWNWIESEREFKRAIELNPSDLPTRHWYASLLAILGRWDEALQELEKARQIDPLSLTIGAVTGWTFYFMRRYDEARLELLKTLDLEQNYYLAHLFMARVNVMQGRTDEAITEFERALDLMSGSCVIMAEVAHAYAMGGQKTRALQLLGELLAQSVLMPQYYMALVYSGL